MTKEIYRIEIPIEVTDKYTDDLKKAEKDIDNFEKAVINTAKDTTKLKTALEVASDKAERLGKASERSEQRVSKFQTSIEKTRNRLRKLTASKWDITVNASDKASKVLSSISSYTHRLAGRSYNVTVRAIDMASRTVRGIGRLVTGIPAVVTVALSVIGAKSLFEATVGSAAKMELAQVQVTSLFGENQKAANEFFNYLNKAGADSMFSSEDFFGSGRAYVPLTKNLNELKYAVAITERLAASNPLEGMEGAAFSVREALSGDLVSLAERFNLPKTMLASIKSAPTLQKKLEALDKVLGQMGYSQKYLDRVNNTGYVRWQKLIDTTSAKLSDFGKAGLEAAKPLISDLTTFVNGKGFDEFGRTLSDGIVWGIERIRTGFNDLDKYFSNPAFKKLDFEGKVNFVLDDISKWWSSKGKPVLDEWWTSKGKPWAEDKGLLMGEAIFNGILIGFKNGFSTVMGMWGDVGTSASENGIFSKETASSAGGAGIATLGLLGLLSMAASPLLKGGGKLIGGGKTILDTGMKLKDKFNKPSDGKPNSTSKLETKTSRTSVILDQYGKPLSPTGQAPTSSPKQTPKTSKLPTFLNPKEWKMPKIPKGVSKWTKRIPMIGTALTALSLLGGESSLSGVVGSLAGGWGGALGGAALGSFLGPVGTIAGGVIGGAGGAIGGEKAASWLSGLFKSNTASAATIESKSPVMASKYTPTSNMSTSNALIEQKMLAVVQHLENVGNAVYQSGYNFITNFAQLNPSVNSLKTNIDSLVQSSGEATGYMKTTFSPLQASGALVGTNMDALSLTLAQSASFTAGAYYPLEARGRLLHTNLDALIYHTAHASASIASFYGISEKVNALKGAIDGMRIRLNNAAIPSISSAGPSVKRSGGVVPYANGGLINRPHMGLVGEAGPEVIIPLSPSRRGRGRELLYKAASALGVRPYADGGMVGVRPYADGGMVGGSLIEGYGVNSSNPIGGTSVSIGDIIPQVQITVQADSSGNIDLSGLSDEIIDQIGVKLAQKIKEAKSNMFITATN